MRVPLPENISAKKQHERAPSGKHIRHEEEATAAGAFAGALLLVVVLLLLLLVVGAAAAAGDGSGGGGIPFQKPSRSAGGQTTLCLAELVVRFLLKMVATPRMPWCVLLLRKPCACG